MSRNCAGRLHFSSVYILRQVPGDIVVLDMVDGHQETRRMLGRFLASSEQAIEIAAAGRCPLDPGMETLRAFRMSKTTALLHTSELPGGVLQVSGRVDLLARYILAFDFDAKVDSDHRHPEQAFRGELARGSIHIIIEVDVEAGGGSDEDAR